MDRITKYKWLALAIIFTLNVVFIYFRDQQLTLLAADSINAGNPVGAYQINDHQTIISDFHMHCAFVERIWKRVTPRPYTLEGQEEIFRNWAPRLDVGMPHAYSPTAAIIGWPFIFLVPNINTSFLIYVALNIFVLLALYQFYFFPRINHFSELIGIFIIGISSSLIGTIVVGQTAVMTLGALALTWHLLYDPITKTLRPLSWQRELLLCFIFYFTTAKPQFAILFSTVLLGTREWRSVLFGCGLFALTCVSMANYYGGWPTWLIDYHYFLSHYYKAAMSPFFRDCFMYQIGSNPTDFLALIANIPDQVSAAIFQPLWLGCAAALVFLAWFRFISPSLAFQLQIANMLLLAPYLRLSEDCLILLLIAEGTVFGTQSTFWETVKIMLLLLIMNSRMGNLETILHFNASYPGKLLLALIIICPLLIRKKIKQK